LHVASAITVPTSAVLLAAVLAGSNRNMDEHSMILALARDNKADEIKQAVQQGVPVSYANKVSI
jgi:hypothetical protein